MQYTRVEFLNEIIEQESEVFIDTFSFLETKELYSEYSCCTPFSSFLDISGRLRSLCNSTVVLRAADFSPRIIQ